MIDDPSLERYHQTFEVPIGSSLPQIDPNIPGYTFYGYAPVEETQSNHVPTNPVTSANVGTTSKNEVNDQAQPMKKESNAEKDETVTEPIPYQTQTIDNPELTEGTTRVKTAGENGVRSIEYRITYDESGKEISRVEMV